MRIRDLTGNKYGRLLVIERVENDKNNNKIWKCVCECGVEKNIGGRHLVSGVQVSCGCKRSENKTNFKHGKAGTKIHNTWCGIKSRCLNHPDYAGRGIKVCDEWIKSFESFYHWSMENGYSDDLTIDRIDNDGDYEASNCRWVDMKVQGSNRRNTKLFNYKGERLSVPQHCRKHNVNKKTVYTRIYRGWTIEEAMTGERMRQ